MFAAVDDVFSEHDAFHPSKLYSGLGRLYRVWKSVRAQIDPDFDSARWRHEHGELDD